MVLPGACSLEQTVIRDPPGGGLLWMLKGEGANLLGEQVTIILEVTQLSSMYPTGFQEEEESGAKSQGKTLSLRWKRKCLT